MIIHVTYPGMSHTQDCHLCNMLPLLQRNGEISFHKVGFKLKPQWLIFMLDALNNNNHSHASWLSTVSQEGNSSASDLRTCWHFYSK